MNKINKIIQSIHDLDGDIIKKTQDKLDSLTKPQGSLGRLEEFARLIAGITAKQIPLFANKVIFTFAADHGIAEEGVSAYPQAVTAQMVYNFLKGGAAINVLARHIGARVIVADLGVVSDLKPHKNLLVEKINYGTKNFSKGPAMTRNEAIKSIEAGIKIFSQEYKNGIGIIGMGEMGIGNSACASAIAAVFTKKPLNELVGYGTGLDEAGLKRKISAIELAIGINKPDQNDPIDVLAKVGGFEIGGLCGAILAACAKKIPVVIDGFISTAAALIAFKLAPKIKNYLLASHCSVEKGHKIILRHIGLEPIFDLQLRLGEGTGAALAMNIVEASVKILTQMATFKSAKVAQKIKC
jgi:nicotinate-nucleotide--dimethylbenzimidazole phosphoribosyltransferase